MRNAKQTEPKRSLWLEEALGAERGVECQALDQETRADICIVGGGYTGLWTALKVKELEPSLDVVLLERDICGGGASGRNAGFMMSWWSKYLSLEKLCGASEAARIAGASEAAVDAVSAFCLEHHIDADVRPDGWLWVATNAAQNGLWRETLEAIGRHGIAPIVEWSAKQAVAACGAPGLVGAAFERHVARVQPAMLARGLRRIAQARGVRIYEHSPLISLAHGNPVTISTQRGRVLADRVVLAMNAWALRWAEIRRAIVAVSGDIIATAPIPERLQRMGWNNALCVSDGRALIQYYRTTRDGRLLYGKGGMSGTFSFRGNVGDEVEGRSNLTPFLTRELHKTFPSLQDITAAVSWRGPVDRSNSGLPFFWRLGSRENVYYAAGFSGNGLAPCYLAGEILSALALERRNEWSECPLVHSPDRDFPPEPFRWLGSKIIRRALLAKDRADDEGQLPSLAARIAVRFAPAGLSPFDSSDEETS